MVLVKSVEIDIGVKGDAAAKGKLDAIDARAEEMKRTFPEFALKIDSAAATEKLALFKAELRDTAKTYTATVKVETDKSSLSRLKTAISDLFGGGRGGGGGLGGLLGGAQGGAGGLGSLGPVGIGGLAAIAAALGPGLIGLGIGGGVGALGIGGSLAAAGYLNAQVKKALAAVKAAQAKGAPAGALPAAQAQLAQAQQLAAPFAGLTTALHGLGDTALMTFAKAVGPLLKPLPGIFADMGRQLKIMQPAMTAMFTASLPFVRAFAGVIMQAGKILMPALTQAMQQMVKSGALPLMVQGITALIKGLAGFVTALGPGMKSSAMLFNDLAVIIQHAMRIAGLAVSWFANAVEWYFHRARENLHSWAAAFDDFRHRTAVIFDGIRHDIAHIWDMIWQNTIGRLMRGIADSQKLTANFGHTVAATFDRLRHDVAAIWDTIWNNTVGRVRHGVNDVMSWISGLPGRITGALGQLGGELLKLGSWALGQLWQGLKNAAGSVAGGGIIGWLGSFAHSVVNVFKKIWGWFSPSSVMYEGGKALMQGLSAGIKDHAHQAIANAQAVASAAIGGVAGSGVQRWRPLVLKALSMERLSATLADAVLYQMQTESGGNPRAINLTDINAQRGDPSRGLMQTIMSTFRAYHWPGTSWDIYDPFANIAAALNYARHNYGPGLRNAYGGIGTGHGYALGTLNAVPGWAWVGERGPELLRFRGGEQVHPAMAGGWRSGPAQVIIRVEVEPSLAAVTPDRTLGRHIAQHVTQFIAAGGRLYPAGTTPR
jgi:SLT domain-containing protein